MPTLPPQLTAILSERYRIERELGAGGMATVYLAQDLKHDREVALKVLRPELGAVLGAERFLAEIKITARLDHPHILTLIDSGAVEGFLYYVLPYVRGESLRVLLNRDTQLGVEEALAITKQIASALDYAHRHGVVHRDIKPENILIQEGEAMLTDFGIALAVKEAGGSRLTETGLSLGTPHYMSPEQATGDRALDARSDLYSLAAVTYEMLAGEPPMTGPTVQAIIAKLMTEQPTRLRTIRPTVPEGVDAAVAKALSKIPADRFATAAEFAKALEQSKTMSTAAVPVQRARPKAIMIAGAVGAALTVAVLALVAARLNHKEGPVALRDRRQLTFTGGIEIPTLSQDGKQLAYWVRSCERGNCTFALEVQDVGSTTTRRVLDGVTAVFGSEWSPDRRNLLVSVSLNGRYGSHLVPANGGTPRLLGSGSATFYAGGDSILIGSTGADSIFTIRVASVDGIVRDSIKLTGPGDNLATLISVPGTTRIVAMIVQGRRGFWQVIERTGKVTDKLHNSCTCGGTASHDALWMTRAGPTVAEAVVRVRLDPATGRLTGRQDTVYTGQFSNVSVTADGTQFAVDDGSYSFTSYALPMADLMASRLPAAPAAQGSAPVGVQVSPDGARLLFRRVLPGANSTSEAKLAVAPWGGAESPLALAGIVREAYWADSTTVGVSTTTAGGLRYQLVDVRTGSSTPQFDPADSTARGFTNVPGGWAWITARRDRVVVDQGGKRRDIAKPADMSAFNQLRASPDGTQLLIWGWNASTEDTVRVLTVPTAGGTPTVWGSSFGEGSNLVWLPDGSVLWALWTGAQSVSLLKMTGPGKIEPLGSIPHVASEVSFSRDLTRATMGWRDYRGDAWVYRVVVP